MYCMLFEPDDHRDDGWHKDEYLDRFGREVASILSGGADAIDDKHAMRLDAARRLALASRKITNQHQSLGFLWSSPKTFDSR